MAQGWRHHAGSTALVWLSAVAICAGRQTGFGVDTLGASIHPSRVVPKVDMPAPSICHGSFSFLMYVTQRLLKMMPNSDSGLELGRRAYRIQSAVHRMIDGWMRWLDSVGPVWMSTVWHPRHDRVRVHGLQQRPKGSLGLAETMCF